MSRLPYVELLSQLSGILLWAAVVGLLFVSLAQAQTTQPDSAGASHDQVLRNANTQPRERAARHDGNSRASSLLASHRPVAVLGWTQSGSPRAPCCCCVRAGQIEAVRLTGSGRIDEGVVGLSFSGGAKRQMM